jgi:hypothetical protein
VAAAEVEALAWAAWAVGAACVARAAGGTGLLCVVYTITVFVSVYIYIYIYYIRPHFLETSGRLDETLRGPEGPALTFVIIWDPIYISFSAALDV